MSILTESIKKLNFFYESKGSMARKAAATFYKYRRKNLASAISIDAILANHILTRKTRKLNKDAKSNGIYTACSNRYGSGTPKYKSCVDKFKLNPKYNIANDVTDRGRFTYNKGLEYKDQLKSKINNLIEK
jgi:hypothetical protein